jgi:hypothetical protein
MTITINRGKLLVAGLAVAMITAACYIAFLVGQATRITEAAATARTSTAVERAVDQTRGQETAKRLAQLKAVNAKARKHETQHVKKLNRSWFDAGEIESGASPFGPTRDS